MVMSSEAHASHSFRYLWRPAQTDAVKLSRAWRSYRIFLWLKVTHGILRPKVLVFEVGNIISVYQSFNATLARHVSR